MLPLPSPPLPSPSTPGSCWTRLGWSCAVHAHPDDEFLFTGALLASLVAAGTQVVLVTATRGEEGEIVTGSVAGRRPPPDRGDPSSDEIEAATRALGILERHWLGTAPALA